MQTPTDEEFRPRVLSFDRSEVPSPCLGNVVKVRSKHLPLTVAFEHHGEMCTETERGRERRWVVILPDGRYATLGRASDPTDDEILRVEQRLRAQGLVGWLAVMEGNPHVGSAPQLLEVRPLADPETSFADAAAACVAAILTRRTEE